MQGVSVCKMIEFKISAGLQGVLVGLYYHLALSLYRSNLQSGKWSYTVCSVQNVVQHRLK